VAQRDQFPDIAAGISAFAQEILGASRLVPRLSGGDQFFAFDPLLNKSVQLARIVSAAQSE